MTNSAAASGSITRLAKWTAVDLVTIALLAVAFRVLWYTGKLIPFPFSELVSVFWLALFLAIAIRLVPKVGVSTLYYFAWALFNTFFQGETMLVSLMLLPLGVLPDVYLWVRRNRMESSVTVVGGATFAAFLYGFVLYFFYVYYFLLPVTVEMWAWVLALEVGVGLVAGLIGNQMGKTVKPLLR